MLTCSSAYQSNAQARVEQKNGILVRWVVGYQRLEGLEVAQMLGEIVVSILVGEPRRGLWPWVCLSGRIKSPGPLDVQSSGLACLKSLQVG